MSVSTPVLKDYFLYLTTYEKKYGKERTIVFMRIGDFFEAYCNNENDNKLKEIADVLNIRYTKRDNSYPFSEKNPHLAGFPVVALTKHLATLINNGYTVVVVDQVSPPPNCTREVTGIYSPGTYIDNVANPDANYIISLYIEEEPQKNTKPLICIGMSAVDLSTGKTIVHEEHSLFGDEKFSLDEAVRFINHLSPKEILINHNIKNIKNETRKENILTYLEVTDKNYRYKDKIDKNFLKTSYQDQFLSKIYNINETSLSPVEYLDIARKPYCTISFVILLDYAFNHNDKITKFLEKPILFQDKKHLILGNNAIFQLNVLESNYYEFSNNKFKSLFDVVNNTSTAMGRRILKEQLLSPHVSHENMETMYSYIDCFIKDKLYVKFEEHLRGIVDIERLHRRLELQLLHPYEFFDFIKSYRSILEIFMLIKTCKSKILKKIQPNAQILVELSEFIKDVEKTFNTAELKNNSLSSVTTLFFNKGVYPDLDEIQNNIDNSLNFIKNLCESLSHYIDDIGKTRKSKEKFNKDDELNSDSDKIKDLKISIKETRREGHYLSLTKLRASHLKEKLKKLKVIKIGNYELDPAKLEFKELPKGNTKIFFSDLKKTSDEVADLKENIGMTIRDHYIEKLVEYNTKYENLFKQITKTVALVDLIKSNAKTAILYNYNKPTIENHSEYGFIACEQLRHPIIERVLDDCEYVPHSLTIGKEMKGMLLYGLNCAGKSSLMKAIGLNIIMAQAGMFVPASKFVFSPYTSLYARITGNDNIFKGLSSFALEMVELRAILKRATPKTLVIGDEICRGTEHVSGNAIVATTVIKLSKSNASFLFATHLHEISEMKRINELKNVKAYHLTVEYDKEKDMLIYDRKLKEGAGENVYGITVARFIIDDPDFITLAQEIKNEFLDVPNNVMKMKQSKYNSDVYIDKCQLCGKQFIDDKDQVTCNYLDTHHIIEQHKCDDNDFVKIEGKTHIKKNQKSNLVVLCKKCHTSIHEKNVEIKGYAKTSKGTKLIVNKKN